MADHRGLLVVREDTIIKGEVRNCRQIEVFGYVEGKVAADTAIIHQGGRCYGTLRSQSAEVSGTLQGNVFVKNLINIRSSAEVSGNVQYGALAMEVGGNLSAEVRNVPPTLAGDFTITVPRGGNPGYPLDRKVYISWHKPIVVLCNQNSGSNAEIFSHAIKTLKRGPIVGVPTAGG